MTGHDDETRLLESLEAAMHSARNLELRDLEHILKMAVLELLHHHVNSGGQAERDGAGDGGEGRIGPNDPGKDGHGGESGSDASGRRDGG